jgi:hypothetical protein
MIMNKGLTMTAAITALILLFSVNAQAEVYKVVDDKGNVTYTDQVPADGSAPMKLPELSVIETDYAAAATADDDVASDDATAGGPTPRELRRMYRDFHINRPAPEETIWGTDSPVVVGWGSATALLPDLSVRLFVNGQPQANTRDSMVALTLERGDYQVYAELLDARGRRVVVTPTVMFFLKQHAVGPNLPAPAPNSGN